MTESRRERAITSSSQRKKRSNSTPQAITKSTHQRGRLQVRAIHDQYKRKRLKISVLCDFIMKKLYSPVSTPQALQKLITSLQQPSQERAIIPKPMKPKSPVPTLQAILEGTLGRQPSRARPTISKHRKPNSHVPTRVYGPSQETLQTPEQIEPNIVRWPGTETCHSLWTMKLNSSTSYQVWSNCMKIYLLGRDLWDVIETDHGETESSNTTTKSWRIRNALALHAMHKSCDADTLQVIGTLESAKQAWDHLRSIYINNNIDDKDEKERVDDGIDYAPFENATTQENLTAVEEFFASNPEANSAAVIFNNHRTALHYILNLGNTEIGEFLVEKIKQSEDLELKDGDGYTAFAYLSNYNQPGVWYLMKRMVEKNKNLPNIGEHSHNIPVVMASWKGFKYTTHYLYSVTDGKILDPEFGRKNLGAELLINCINNGWFGIASEMVTKFPKILQQHNGKVVYPIHALAKFFSALETRRRRRKSRAFKLNHWLSRSWKYAKQYTERTLLGYELVGGPEDTYKLAYDKACTFLLLVCDHISNFDVSQLEKYVYAAMMEASKNGSIEFVSEMVIANPNLIQARVGARGFIPCAIENRQEKVYSIIHSFFEQKDTLLATDNNILHLAAKLPPIAVMGRTSGPAMAMQREILWFEQVWSMANPRYRDELNDMNLTPRDFFALEHKDLINEGERAMKETANSAAFVGALILTVSFAAAFTVPGGIKADGLPLFVDRVLFKIFVVCDALSLYSAIASILAILRILTSSFAEIDFLFKSPRRLMIGLATLWFSLLTMMLVFCTVLALMLEGLFRYILPIALLVLVPVILFTSPIFPLCFEIYRSTYGTVLFERNTRIRKRIEKNRKMRRRADVKNLRAEENIILTNPSTVDEIV